MRKVEFGFVLAKASGAALPVATVSGYTVSGVISVGLNVKCNDGRRRNMLADITVLLARLIKIPPHIVYGSKLKKETSSIISFFFI